MLLTSFTTNENIWLVQSHAGNKKDTMFNISKQREMHHEVKDVLLFCHSMSGCDTIFSEREAKVSEFIEKRSG